MAIFGSVRDLHLELTSRCTLRCPRCQRTSDPERLAIADLPLEIVRASMTRQSFPDLRFINMCGNYGDAIYHPRFHDIMEHLKHQGFDLRLETNGCHRPARWWRRTAEIFSRRDRVTLSIDGLDDTNHIYRVNARWPDILEAVAALKGRVFLVWKLIVFRHNQHQVEEAEERARELGFDEFRIVRSSRFDGRWRGPDGTDPLKPTAEWVGERKAITERIRGAAAAEVRIVPRCARGENIFVSAEGFLLPCCYAHILLRATMTASEASKSADRWFERNRHLFDLRRRSVTEILADDRWSELGRSWSTEGAPSICRRYCGVPAEYDLSGPAELRKRDLRLVALREDARL
jgi:MoaA/NifB/PqqE/SkfB family radical SAM enzyme